MKFTAPPTTRKINIAIRIGPRYSWNFFHP